MRQNASGRMPRENNNCRFGSGVYAIAKLELPQAVPKIISQTNAKFKFAGVFLSLAYENPPESYKFPEGLKEFTYCCYLLTEVVVEYAFGRNAKAV